MIKIAIYGKGGVGKSTIASNISYLLSTKGYSVCHIGCDPKHDSTRSLVPHKDQVTVLDSIRSKGSSIKISDIVLSGLNGVNCIEIGGPEPGIGCAGRGMLTAFDTLDKLGFKYKNYDVILYDVLGDVVCGGFAVPLRKDNADAVYIVTSGEFMSLYAANNIIRGMLNFDPDTPRIAGIILNMRGIENEYDIVVNFSNAVKIPIIAVISRDDLFSESEKKCEPITKRYPNSDPSMSIGDIVNNLQTHIDRTGQLFLARPLNDDQLEDLAKGVSVRTDSINVIRTKDSLEFNEQQNMLNVCATKGAAVMVASGITDLQMIIHGPKSCGHMIRTATVNHYLLHMNVEKMFKIEDNVYCTCMDEMSSVFGGINLLEQLVEELIAIKKTNIIIITTCVSGILGDNVIDSVNKMKSKYSDAKIIFISADGIMSGESKDGRMVAIEGILKIIDPNIFCRENKVTVFDDFYYRFGSNGNNNCLIKILELMDLELDIKLFDDCTMQNIITVKKNRITLMAKSGEDNSKIKTMLENKGIKVFKYPLPRGINDSEKWISEFTRSYDISNKKIKKYSQSMRNIYTELIKNYTSITKDKRVGIFSITENNIDWVLDVLADLEMNISEIIIFNEKDGFAIVSKHENIITCTNTREMTKKILSWNVDLIVGDVDIPKIKCKYITNMKYGRIFFDPSIELVHEIKDAFKNGKKEEWKKWAL